MAKSSFQVLYIDDDEFMLKAASRLLRRLKPDWSITLIQDPATWRDLTDAQAISPDLVLSDLIMPELKGDELLAQVSQHFPNSIRALITGDTTVEIEALTNNWTHFILPKPFSEKDFEQILTCAERLRTLPFSTRCRQKLAGIENLPVLPSIVRQLERCMDDEQCGSAEFAHIVANEPPLVGQVIKAANSVYLGFESRTNSLSTAVSRLGMKVVCGIAMTMMNRNAFRQLSDEEHEAIVAHHQTLANLAGALAQQLHWSVEEQDNVYLVCLLSAIGELILKEMGHTQTLDSDNPLDLQVGYRDTDVISAYVLILWGYHLPVAEAILTLGQTSDVAEPHQWEMGQLVHFCHDYAQAQHAGTLNEWLDSLPEPLAVLPALLLSPEE
ncbi:response regulator [Vibrio coralliilyticus]|uniref:HDOD domain-containing protein n=1 Tax=Vibrio coralliilyticus TaxID=190893 RepID=UPI0006CD4077|nr:HDOD domain-containing protein [Vibrio coralliilyticus]AXN34679.1 response regulator [Vibrio coralliilyticus]KPH25128.1 response regulator [Vibrio coralliilyticus]PAU35946.1 response regulator [Vibrio coralliilyticus]